MTEHGQKGEEFYRKTAQNVFQFQNVRITQNTVHRGGGEIAYLDWNLKFYISSDLIWKVGQNKKLSK